MKDNWVTFFVWSISLFVLPLLIVSEYAKHLLVISLIYVLLAQGLNLTLGYTGNLSLGQAALYALGAYVPSLLIIRTEMNFWVALLIGIIFVTIIGLILGAIGLRNRGSAFIIMTISFSTIVHLILVNWVELTNGQMGISGLPNPSLFGYTFATKNSYYYLLLLIVLLVQFFVRQLVNSKIGRAFIAVKQDESLAISLGISPFHYSLLAFVLGSTITGLAGGLYMGYAQFVSPEMSNFHLIMLSILMMTVVGGRGTIWGPVVGAFIFTFLPEYLRIVEDLRMPIFGLMLILMVLFIPEGLIPTIKNLYMKNIDKFNKREDVIS